MIGPRSQCSVCTRFRSPLDTGADGPTCAAFPTGIPPAVLRNLVDHRKEIPGDHGLRWESDGRDFPEYALAEQQSRAVRPELMPDLHPPGE